MKTHEAYCEKQGRFVRLTLHDESHVGATIPAVVCLDQGEGCAGLRCPITGVSPALMQLRLARLARTRRVERREGFPDNGDGEVTDPPAALP
jgi:hypothetical protein